MEDNKKLIGQKFGRLTVVGEAYRVKQHNVWPCQCKCGNKKDVDEWRLISGNTRSCGCINKERIKMLNYTHGSTDTRLYGVWCAMKSRCNNSNDRNYDSYGGRGIKVCPEWNDNFVIFQEWALSEGYDEGAPRGKCTLDRIDVNGGYSPENCRIVNQQVQTSNRRTTPKYTYNGETHSLGEWAIIFGIPYKKLWQRMDRGHSFEEAINM